MTRYTMALVMFAALAGCSPLPEAGEEEAAVRATGGGSGGDTGGTTGGGPTRPPPVYGGWTPFTSDEDRQNQAQCGANMLVTEFRCTGSYCDNLQLYCQSSAAFGTGVGYQTVAFSEEAPYTYQVCIPGFWVTGITCTGAYCDNVSLKCAEMTNATEKNCRWTQETSEEDAGIDFVNRTTGKLNYVKGAACTGQYCDNMSFYVCEI